MATGKRVLLLTSWLEKANACVDYSPQHCDNSFQSDLTARFATDPSVKKENIMLCNRSCRFTCYDIF